MNRPITSASNLHRRIQCPGSARLESQCPTDKGNELAARGTLMHEALAEGMSEAEFTEYEEWCMEFCQSAEDSLTKEFFGDKTPTIAQEVELDFNLPDGTTIKGFGHPDRVAYIPGKALVKDRKFGFLKVEHAKSNPQLRAYAVMVADQYLAEHVALAIVQPRAKAEERISIVVYTADDIELARKEISGILEASEKPDAQLIPDLDACRYCRAKAVCPALKTEADEITMFVPNRLMRGDAAWIWKRCKVVEQHIAALKKEIFLMVQNAEAEGVSILGITLKPGVKRRVVTDVQKAFAAMQDSMGTAEFVNCCTVKISELEKVFKASTGLKGKAANAEFESLLSGAGCLEIKQNESSLELTNLD